MPTFLRLDEILEIHEDQIQRYGGDGGVRDASLILSAIAQPQATFDGRFLHSDIFEMAAAYLFHISQNHGFMDGNKRTATAAAIVFLEMNDQEIDAMNEELEAMVLSVANGEADKRAAAQFFRDHAS